MDSFTVLTCWEFTVATPDGNPRDLMNCTHRLQLQLLIRAEVISTYSTEWNPLVWRWFRCGWHTHTHHPNSAWIVQSALGVPIVHCCKDLRCPATILFISRDSCSDSIAKLCRACFRWYRTIIARYVANGVSRRCACVKLPLTRKLKWN